MSAASWLAEVLRTAAPGPFWLALVEALGALGASSAGPALLAQLEPGLRELYRAPLLRALGRVGGPGAREALLAALDQPDRPSARAAAESLARLAAEEAADPLLDALCRAEDPAPYATALASLHRAHPRLSLGDRVLLRAFFSGEATRAAQVAACALLRPLGAQGAEEFLRELARGQEAELRRAARRALASKG